METITRNCIVCGKELKITLNADGSYEGGNYFGNLRLGIGDYAVGELVNGELIRTISWFKYFWYKLCDFKKLLLKQYKEIEYWECDECCSEPEELCT